MKKRRLLLLFWLFIGCTSTHNDKSVQESINIELIPINYNYENLYLKINSSLSDSTNKDFWSWDYLSSSNGMPDSTGIDYFKNLNQPVFWFNDESTLPGLFAKTEGNRIIEFSATTIFNLPDCSQKSIDAVLDALTNYELLNIPEVRKTVLEKRYFQIRNQKTIETIQFECTDELSYDRIIYKIELR